MLNKNSRQLLLNLAQIKFDSLKTEAGFSNEFKDAEIEVGTIDPKQPGQAKNKFNEQLKERLKDLRRLYSQTHFFHRSGNEILSIPCRQNSAFIGDRPTKIRLSQNLSLCAALARNALINFLFEMGRSILEFRPLIFLADRQTDILASSLPSGVICPSWLSVRPTYEVDVRVITLDRQPSFVGLALNTWTSKIIDISCEELIAKGFPIVGLYVGQYLPQFDARVAPRLQRIGRVSSIAGDRFLLDDAREGIQSVEIKEAYLIRDTEAYQRCLVHAFGDRANEVDQRIKQNTSAFVSGPNRLQHLKKVISYLGNLKLEMIPGLNFTIQNFLAEGTSALFPEIRKASKPVFVYDPAGRRTGSWPDGDIDRHGPYNYQNHTPTRPRVCVICQASQQGLVEKFLDKFVNGTLKSIMVTSGIRPNQGEKRGPFDMGLLRKYRLDDISFEYFKTEDDSAEAYQKAVRKALEFQRDRDFTWDLAMVQIEERFHKLYGERNPYFITKSSFLTQQIPVQEFETETASLPEYSLAYAMNQMALATYAKLGGVPWLMQAGRTTAHELVFGLGSASIGDGRLGKKERVVGITTVFSGEGKYHLANISQAVPIAEYKSTLLASLKSTIDRVKSELNWQKRQHIRLIFHNSFKSFSDDEADAVEEVVKGLGDYQVDLAFLQVIEDHPYLLFDENQKGVGGIGSRQLKGICAPERGYFFRLSGHEVLISLKGVAEVKSPEHGMPRPLLLKLHRNSSFKDTTYLAQQVFAFSCHSWQGFSASPMPVTIRYSDLIAKLLGNLATVPSWNSEVMLGRIGTMRWFL